jgi:hypothetical protein
MRPGWAHAPQAQRLGCIHLAAPGSRDVNQASREPLFARLRCKSACGIIWRMSEGDAKIAQLEMAVEHRTTIGVAIGMLMERFSISREQGFALLTRVSQQEHRKVYDLAVELSTTGRLSAPSFPDSERPRPGQPRTPVGRRP